MSLKPLFKYPLGASQDFSGDFSEDCFQSSHTASGHALQVITCQLCGRTYLKDRDVGNNFDYYFHFLGYRGVRLCCGKLIDILYQQWGKDFFKKTLSEFKKNPFAVDNTSIRENIKEVLKLLHEKSRDTTES